MYTKQITMTTFFYMNSASDAYKCGAVLDSIVYLLTYAVCSSGHELRLLSGII